MITEKIKKFQSFLPLDEVMKQSIKNFLDVKYNYNSNAIEGTTLSEAETVEVLRGNTVPKHSLVEHFEVINHKNAFNFIWELTNGFDNSKKSWEEIFTKKNLFEIHKILLNNINPENAGLYRRHNVRISFSRAVLPRWEKVDSLMEDFFEKYLQEYKKLKNILDFKTSLEGQKNSHAEFSSASVIKKAGKQEKILKQVQDDVETSLEGQKLEKILEYGYKLHIDFVKIHPFIDGNGRTARLLQNLFFLNEINNINIIYFKNRKEYIDSIENFEKNPRKYFDFMNKNFEEFKLEELELLKNKIFYKI